jgi:predicted nucleic acid-binding protein
VPVVIDNSVAMAWCFADETTPVTDTLLQRVRLEGAVAPSIWPLEVANVLLNAERRGRITQAQTEQFIELLEALSPIIDPGGPSGAFGPILALGRQYGLTSYDATYLEVAQRRGLALATQDRRLSEVAAQMGITLIRS